MLCTVRGVHFRQAQNARHFPKSRSLQRAAVFGTARRSLTALIPLSSKAPLPPTLSAATTKRISDSEVFKTLVLEGLIPKNATGFVVKIGAWASMAMALFAWLLPNYWVAPAFGVDVAKITAELLLGVAGVLYLLTIHYAWKFQHAKVFERILMEEGTGTFGDEFAAAVQARREGALYRYD